MFTISVDPVIISFGHLALRWYSLIVLAAIVLAVWISGREAERKGLNTDAIYDLALWLAPAGLVGARLFHVADHWAHEYAADPLRTLYVWQGGWRSGARCWAAWWRWRLSPGAGAGRCLACWTPSPLV